MPVRFVCASAIAEPRFAGLAIGDWATWAGSFLAGLSLLLLVTGSLRDRSERRWLERSAQARSVGAWLRFIDGFESDELWEVTIQNASSLPVRNVKAYLIRAGDPPRAFEEVPVVVPGTQTLRARIPRGHAGVHLVLIYHDDAGVRWRKYTSNKPIAELSPDKPDLPGL